MIEKGSKVKIHYSLTVEGQVLDDSNGKDPLSYVQGGGDLVPGVEEQLAGLKPGDEKKITVTAEKGYGPRNEDAHTDVPKDKFNDSATMQVGQVVTGQSPQGQFNAIVTKITDETISLDFNHPLAGKTLDFEIKVIDVEVPDPSKAPEPPKAPEPS